MPMQLIQIKQRERKYRLPELEWESLLDAATDGLVNAIQKYDSKRNDSIEAWAYMVMEQHFNKRLNTIIRERMRDQKIAERYSLNDRATKSMTMSESGKEKVVLSHRDYELLEYIIACNQQKDSNGKPFCPNSSDIIKKGRFESSIKSRTTVSTSIRRLKDAGYRFAEKKDRGTGQGYFILNPELHTQISFEEKLALDVLHKLLPQIPGSPISTGLQLLLHRIEKTMDIDVSTSMVVDDETVSWNPGTDLVSMLSASMPRPEILEQCVNAAKERKSVALIVKTQIDGDHSEDPLCIECSINSVNFCGAEGGWNVTVTKAEDPEKAENTMQIAAARILTVLRK